MKRHKFKFHVNKKKSQNMVPMDQKNNNLEKAFQVMYKENDSNKKTLEISSIIVDVSARMQKLKKKKYCWFQIQFLLLIIICC